MDASSSASSAAGGTGSTHSAASTPVATPPTAAQRLTAEALGTMIVVVAVAATAIGTLDADPISAGFAAVAAMYAFGRLSGGHFNPAVTVGSAFAGRTSWGQAGGYIGAQFAGGVLAGLFLLIYGLGGDGFEAFDTPLGADGWGDDGTGYAVWAAFLVTLVVTALFVLLFLGLTDERNEHRSFAPLGVGLALVAAIAITTVSTGGTVNPAQSFGLAVFSGGDPLLQVWVFLIAPLLGGVAAGFGYPALFGADREAVPGSGLSFARKKAVAAPTAYAPAGYQQQWGPSAGGGYQQPATGSYAAPGAQAQAPVEQPIIQDGWQWDPQAQQWIPAQQQAPQQGGWSAPSSSEQTQIRPGDGV